MPVNDFTLVPHPDYQFLQIKPTPTEAEITEYYAKEFYSSGYPTLNDSSLETQTEDKLFYDSHREDICAFIEKAYGRPVTGLSLLDVGCGWGQALLYFKSKKMEVCGFDPSPEAAAYGEKLGIDIRVAGFQTLAIFNRQFDVVTLFNVLEHLADPVAVVREIYAKILKPGGLLIIDVPNEFNDFQVAGQQTHGLPQWWVAPPAHLNYFSNDSLGALLRGCGFQVLQSEASFPMELFLLLGRNYVGDPKQGKICHQERVTFEMNLRKCGKTETMKNFYQALAALNLGRQVVAYAQKPLHEAH